MREIYLIRHTTPAVARGICYGQTDLDITASFYEEAGMIRELLPSNITRVHSSPLQRCSKLAALLFPGHEVQLHDELKEIHCGQWEMRPWDELPREELDPWMKDFVQVRIPGGESYNDVFARVTRCYESIKAEHRQASAGATAIVSHGGVFRSILSYITSTPLIDSFKVFPLYYGCLARVNGEGAEAVFDMLLNRVPEEPEQHRPSYFRREAL